jgi:hypothetical protein
MRERMPQLMRVDLPKAGRKTSAPIIGAMPSWVKHPL